MHKKKAVIPMAKERVYSPEVLEKMQVVVQTYEAQKQALGRTGAILDYKLEVTIERLKNGRHNRCDCGAILTAEALEKLEIFCPQCLSKQSNQAIRLYEYLNELREELNEVSGKTRTDLQENSHNVQSNHEADSSPNGINSNLTILIPGIQKRIKCTEEAILRVPLGKYGFCVDCQEEIPEKRLEKVIFASHCVECGSKAPTGKVKHLVLTL